MTELFFVQLNQANLAYRLYENPLGIAGRSLLLIHGAGVGGQLTWESMLPYLENWQYILLPDLRGMGDTHHHSGEELPVSISDLAHDIHQLTEHLQWINFDVVGYSLGGAVSIMLNQRRIASGLPCIEKVALLEPATFDREPLEELYQLRLKYRKASEVIRLTGDLELGIAQFLDGVAANRRKNEMAERTTQSRLAHRPYGFAYALDAVTDLVETFIENPEVRDDLYHSLPAVMLFAGGLSDDRLKAYYQKMVINKPEWRYVEISNTDHSLPFQKPRQIAKKLNEWF